MITPSSIISNTLLTNVLATIYTAPVNQKVDITKFTVTNTNTVAVTIDFYIIDSGDTASDEYYLIKSIALAPSESRDLGPMRQLLEPGDYVHGKASVTSVVNVKAKANIIT